MSDTTNVGRHLDIIELGTLCTAMRARNLALFEQLGSWVADTSNADQQRLFAEACHRHAWHAELWEHRSPSIPAVEQQDRAVHSDAAFVAPDDRAAAYAAAVDQLLTELDALAARVEVLLDPGTVRVIDLTRADLVAIRQRLAAARVGH